MNKMKQHAQEVWFEIVGILTEPFFYTDKDWRNFKVHNHIPRTVICLEELADALTQKGVMNYYGRPYNHWSLRKMIERMNDVDEELDFRQQHYPMFLYLKDNNIGLRTPTRPARPLKSRTVKTVDANDELDPNLIKRHITAVPRYMRKEIIFGASVQSVQ